MSTGSVSSRQSPIVIYARSHRHQPSHRLTVRSNAIHSRYRAIPTRDRQQTAGNPQLATPILLCPFRDAPGGGQSNRDHSEQSVSPLRRPAMNTLVVPMVASLPNWKLLPDRARNHTVHSLRHVIRTTGRKQRRVGTTWPSRSLNLAGSGCRRGSSNGRNGTHMFDTQHLWLAAIPLRFPIGLSQCLLLQAGSRHDREMRHSHPTSWAVLLVIGSCHRLSRANLPSLTRCRFAERPWNSLYR